PRCSPPVPYTTLFRSLSVQDHDGRGDAPRGPLARALIATGSNIFSTPAETPGLRVVARGKNGQNGISHGCSEPSIPPARGTAMRSEEHTSELQSRENL